MKLIVGLGNPGVKYDHTRHNVGFMAIDAIAKRHQVEFKPDAFLGESTFYFDDKTKEKVYLLKPQTFMNESGKSVAFLSKYYGIDSDEIAVIQDDLDLPAGKIRFKQSSSHGGHNGIRSIIDNLGTKKFKRVKIGIDRPQNTTVVNWVLNQFSKKDQPLIEEGITNVADALDLWTSGTQFDQIMNQNN